MVKTAINGIGRIGRATMKIILEKSDLQLVAVNDIAPIDDIAYLLRYDSVYGRYEKTVESQGDALMVDDTKVKYLSEKDPANLPWEDLDIDIVFECSGVFSKEEDLRKHVEAGASYVILSAPAKSEGVSTVVFGASQGNDDPEIRSCASCTTNCITPVVEIMDRRLGIKKANMTTIHAYTSSQSIVDTPADKKRRGRAAAVNFVPTTTGAAKATALALPQVEGKFDGAAIRGPIPAGSIADINFVMEKPISVKEINNIFRKEAESERYKGVVGVSDEELVSSDIIKDPRASIVDLTMTQVVDGDLVKIMSWYDNEWGYANQMVKEEVRISEIPSEL